MSSIRQMHHGGGRLDLARPGGDYPPRSTAMSRRAVTANSRTMTTRSTQAGKTARLYRRSKQGGRGQHLVGQRVHKTFQVGDLVVVAGDVADPQNRVTLADKDREGRSTCWKGRR